jgi:hypothetical protein
MDWDWVKGPAGEFCCDGKKGGYWPEFNTRNHLDLCPPIPSAILQAGAGAGAILGTAAAAFAGEFGFFLNIIYNPSFTP